MIKISERKIEHIEAYLRVFDYPGQRGSGYAFDCDASGALLATAIPASRENFRRCLSGEIEVIDRGVRDISRDITIDAEKRCECGGAAYLARGCGVFVCTECGAHEGLARCYCGWAASGGDGYAELTAYGETIEEDY